MNPYYGLADCNNFYASCERAFNPHLRNRPIAILSNNDGCIVARSNELKSLDIPMGVPYWKHKHLLKKYNTAVLSSNYRLYGDMSNRVMEILEDRFADVEVYSIDEAFIRANGFTDEGLEKYGEEVRSHLLQWTGLPVSLGFGRTKTLSKLANKLAKKTPSGVCLLTTEHPILDELPITKVWGINKGLGRRLNAIGVYTIRQFMNANQNAVRKRCGVVGLRLLLELNGMPCHDLIAPRETRKHIMVSRTFKSDLTGKKSLIEAVSKHAARAGEKLRDCNQIAGGMSIFLRSNPYKSELRQVRLSAAGALPIATSDTSVLIQVAQQMLHSIFDKSVAYKKLGVLLHDLRPRNPIQTNLFEPTSHIPRRNDLMDAMDALNAKWGKGTLRMASYAQDIHHLYRKEKQSPEYTTSWDDILEVE